MALGKRPDVAARPVEHPAFVLVASIPEDWETCLLLPPHTSPTPLPALFPPYQPSSEAQVLTRRCRRRLRAGAWTGTLCHTWHTGTAPGEPLYGNCVEALWGKDFRENGTVSGSYSAVSTSPLSPQRPSQGPCFSGLPTYWCSIWKLRCPLNQSLKADLWTLHVAWSWRKRAGKSVALGARWKGQPSLLQAKLAKRKGCGTVPGGPHGGRREASS